VHTNEVDLSPYIPRDVDERSGTVASPESFSTHISENNEAKLPEVGG